MRKEFSHLETFPSRLYTSSFRLQHFFVCLPALCLTLLLSGCSTYIAFYVINDTDHPVTITFITMHSLQMESGDIQLPIRYRNAILPITHNTRDRLTDTLAYTVKDSVTFAITLPQYSTTFIGGATNRRLDFRAVHLTAHNTSIALDPLQFQKSLKRTNGFLSNVYEILSISTAFNTQEHER